MFCILPLGGIFVLVCMIIVRFLKIDLEYLLEENKKKRRHMISEGDRSLKTYKNQTIDDNHEQLIIRSVHASPRVSNSLRRQHKNENDTRLDRTSVCPEIIYLLFIYQLQSIVNSQKQKREKNDHALLFSKEKESLKNDEKISGHCEEDVLQTVEVDDYSSESTKVMCLENRNTIPSFTYRTSNSYSPEFPSLPSSLLTYTEDDSLNYLLSSIDTVYNDIRFEYLPSEDVKKNISHEKRCLNKIRLSSNIKNQSSGEEYQITLPTEKLVMQNKAGTGDHPNYPIEEAFHSSGFTPLVVQLRIHPLANGQAGNRNVNETQQEETKSTCCQSYIQSSTTSQSQMKGEIIESAVVSCTKDFGCIEGLRQESMNSSTYDSDDSDVNSHQTRPESYNETEKIQSDNSSVSGFQHEGKSHQPVSFILQDTADNTPTRETQLESLMKDPLGMNFDGPKYPSYAIHAVRLSSYSDWPAAMTQTPHDMATAGFFYDGHGDCTRCFFCGGGLRNWDAGDDPWVEHARWFSQCAFVRQNRGQQFIDLVLRCAAEMEEQSQQDIAGNSLSSDSGLWEYGVDDGNASTSNVPIVWEEPNHQGYSAAGAPPLPPSREAQLEALRRDPMGINFDRPKYPSYAVLASRISSYTNWPTAMTQTPRDMALAGFFYAGYGDSTRCFFCGGGLRKWEAGDDPWVEHARWFSKCAFVRQNRGQQFIDLVLRCAAEMEEQRREQDETGNSQTNKLTIKALSKEEKIMKSATVISIKDMGYSEEIIKTAIHTIKSRPPRGKHKVSAQEILEVLFKLADSQRTSANSSRSEPQRTGNQLESSRLSVQSRANTENGTNNVSQSDSTTEKTDQSANEEAVRIVASNAGLGEYGIDNENTSTCNDLESLQRENENLKRITICKVCMDETVSVVFLPCGHLTCCADCAPAMLKCPICWEVVKRTTNAYLIRSG